MAIRIQGRCVFCGGYGLSKEHIWSDWLKKALPRMPPHRQHRWESEMQVRENAVYVQPLQPQAHNAALNQRKIRNVCQNCNNGWMSGVVKVAQPFAEKLIQGEEMELDAAAQRALATWITIATIMAEYTDPNWQRVPPEDRKALYETRAPLPDWTVRLGRFAGGGSWWPMRYRHYGGTMITTDATVRPNFQLTTYTLGHLVVQAFSADHPPLVSRFRNEFAHPDLVQIAPFLQPLSWPLTHWIQPDQMEIVAEKMIIDLHDRPL